MAKSLQYHFLWREQKDNLVLPLAWSFEVCFLVIIDRVENFPSVSQRAVGSDIYILRIFVKSGKNRYRGGTSETILDR